VSSSANTSSRGSSRTGARLEIRQSSTRRTGVIARFLADP
jgi:hypothetical protein